MDSECTCRDEGAVVEATGEVVTAAAELLAPHFRRAAAQQHAADYLRGLLAEVERKNGWQLAEQVGYAHPRGIQRVLDRYVWDADAVRDDLRRYVIAEFGDPAGVLVVDETGFPKQGWHSAGVARQYSGTLGKIANCQVGVFLGYASPAGHVCFDRELFIPETWAADRERCQRAGIPDRVGHQTKPQLALTMLERALDGGVPAAWVSGDEVYGNDSKLRRALEGRGPGYVLAVRSNQSVTTWPPYAAPGQTTVAALRETVAADDWERLSCGEGAQGPRVYDWAWVPLRPAERDGWVHGLLLRRHPERTEEVADYLTCAPTDTPRAELVQVAGARWSIDDLFKLAKGQVGLDHYEVRSWRGWYRHITLALLALTVLAVGARKRGATLPAPRPHHGPGDPAAPRPTPLEGPSTPLTKSPPGRAGAATTSEWPRPATSTVAA